MNSPVPIDVNAPAEHGKQGGPQSRPAGSGDSEYVHVLEHIPDAFMALDSSWTFTYVNWKVEHLLGKSREDILGKSVWEEFPETVQGGWLTDCQRAISKGVTLHLENYFPHRNAWFEIHAYPARDGISIYLRDISDRKWTEQSLRNSEHFARTILSSVGEGIVVFDRDLRCRLWNRFMEELSEQPSEDVLGSRAEDLFPTFAEHGLSNRLERALGGETVRLQEGAYPGDDSERWIDGIFTPQKSPDGEVIGVVGIIHDITERQKAEERLLHTAFHDPLTGLPNRSYFMDRLRRSTERVRHNPEFLFGVLFLDLDRFKVVNDSLGHFAGDELLVQLARRLEELVRPGDTVARLGGDEFAVLLYDLQGEDDCTAIARRIQAGLNAPFVVQERNVFTSASVGIALSAKGYERPEDFLRDADIAMYRAKAAGRGRFELFGRDMHDQAVALLQLETDLRLALEREEFLLHYQPIIRLETGRLVGFEALLRWKHPDRGLISPAKFIDVAEDTGLILPLGRWVLARACEQLHGWRDQFKGADDLSIHVNLSGKQFLQPDGIEEIGSVVSESGLPGGSIKLEITESVILENADAVADALAALRERGLELSIDDFGTGYSSLSYLHQFPFDTLKIDRSFVSKNGVDESNLEIVRAIIALAHNLGMDVIAEGVETARQLEDLRKLECEYGQGYLFSSPLDEDSAAEYIRTKTEATKVPID